MKQCKPLMRYKKQQFGNCFFPWACALMNSPIRPLYLELEWKCCRQMEKIGQAFPNQVPFSATVQSSTEISASQGSSPSFHKPKKEVIVSSETQRHISGSKYLKARSLCWNGLSVSNYGVHYCMRFFIVLAPLAVWSVGRNRWAR